MMEEILHRKDETKSIEDLCRNQAIQLLEHLRESVSLIFLLLFIFSVAFSIYETQITKIYIFLYPFLTKFLNKRMLVKV